VGKKSCIGRSAGATKTGGALFGWGEKKRAQSRISEIAPGVLSYRQY
jgi:hypothetical protein